MQSIFGEASRLLTDGEPFVLASVVETKGSTPQKPGAKLLVRRDGSTVGTLGGGCVEADIWAEAKVILEAVAARDSTARDSGEDGSAEARSQAQLRSFELTEDIAAQDGLVCGGTMNILIDPIVGQRQLLPLFGEILAAYDGQGDRALVTCIETSAVQTGAVQTGGGLSDQSTRLFVRADGSTVGSLGNGDLDRLAINSALEEMPKGRERWLETETGKRLYVETFTHPPTVVIAGGGHVGMALYTLATFLGFRTIVVDDRPRFANAERFPQADQVVVDTFDSGLRSLTMGPNHYVIVATRGHKLDDVALLEAARSDAGYVGLLGSKRKAVLILRELYRAGVAEERVREIHAPVGLDIGGRQPEEIAVSILAEILAEKNQRSGAPMRMDDKVVAKVKKVAARRG